MKQILIKWLNKLRGQRLVAINRTFHAFFNLGKKELRATESYCRNKTIYNYIDLERY